MAVCPGLARPVNMLGLLFPTNRAPSTSYSCQVLYIRGTLTLFCKLKFYVESARTTNNPNDIDMKYGRLLYCEQYVLIWAACSSGLSHIFTLHRTRAVATHRLLFDTSIQPNDVHAVLRSPPPYLARGR